MKFDANQVLWDTRKIAWKNWKEYHERVIAGERFLEGIRDLFEQEVRSLDWAIARLERMGQGDIYH